jgi:hypothetical protein
LILFILPAEKIDSTFLGPSARNSTFALPPSDDDQVSDHIIIIIITILIIIMIIMII